MSRVKKNYLAPKLLFSLSRFDINDIKQFKKLLKQAFRDIHTKLQDRVR